MLFNIIEAVNQKLIDDMVPPLRGARLHLAAGFEVEFIERFYPIRHDSSNLRQKKNSRSAQSSACCLIRERESAKSRSRHEEFLFTKFFAAFLCVFALSRSLY